MVSHNWPLDMSLPPWLSPSTHRARGPESLHRIRGHLRAISARRPSSSPPAGSGREYRRQHGTSRWDRGLLLPGRRPEALAAWYEVNLGISSLATGGSWGQEAGPTVFAPFPADTDYFGRRDQQSMLNFRVANLDAMLSQLRVAGAQVEDETAEASYGRFGHAVDPEGNRFELWEPAKIPNT